MLQVAPVLSMKKRADDRAKWVDKIRREARTGNETLKELADRYRLAIPQISYVLMAYQAGRNEKPFKQAEVDALNHED